MKFKTQKVKIGDVLELVIDHRGKTPKKMGFDDFHSEGYPVLSAKHVKTDFLANTDAIRFANEEMYKKWMKIEIQKGDIALTSEAPLGEVYYLDGEIKYLLGQRLFGLRPIKDKIDPLYLAAWLASPIGQSQLKARASGSTVQGIKQSELLKVEIDLPPMLVQKEIGKIRREISDKITTNTQMNQTLEKIAQRIFKSWFIDFDPVKANAEGIPFAGLSPDIQSLFPKEFVESEMGLVPKGWEVKSLGDVSTCYDSKRVPVSKTKREQIKGIYPYYGATSLMGHVNDYIFDGVYVLLGEDGSVIKDDNTPFIQYVWGKIWVNNHAHVLQGTENVSTEQLMLHLQRTNVSEFITGAVQLKINQSNMNRIPFIKANSEINEAFQKIVEPMYKKLRENHEQTQTLIKLRDRLLPKLLSGSIEIKQELEKLDEAS